jgi:hypothetical protein
MMKKRRKGEDKNKAGKNPLRIKFYVASLSTLLRKYDSN